MCSKSPATFAVFLSLQVHLHTLKVSLSPLYSWRISREKKYQVLPACTTYNVHVPEPGRLETRLLLSMIEEIYKHKDLKYTSKQRVCVDTVFLLPSEFLLTCDSVTWVSRGGATPSTSSDVCAGCSWASITEVGVGSRSREGEGEGWASGRGRLVAGGSRELCMCAKK